MVKFILFLIAASCVFSALLFLALSRLNGPISREEEQRELDELIRERIREKKADHGEQTESG